MKKLEHWLEKEGKKEARRARFDDALISDRAFGYAGYRLRYLGIRVLLKAALHLAEITLFSMYFPPDFIAAVIIIRSATFLAVSLWWGGLEQLRETVRDHTRNRNFDLATRTVEAWLSLGSVFSLAAFIIGTMVIVFNTHEDWGFSVYNAYAIACFIRLALDITARTYHSGIFAIRRVFRPLWSLLLGDVLDVALVIVLWPVLGVWGFSISLVLVGLIRFVILINFVKNAYLESPFPAIRLRRVLTSLTSLKGRDIGKALIHAAANGAAQIDTIFIVVLTSTASTGSQVSLAIALYILRPFISAGNSWVRLFYFDFKLLDARYSDFLRIRFERFIQKVSLLFSIGLGAVCALWMYFFFGDTLQLAAAALLPFLVVRSNFGLNQMLAFSYNNYKTLFTMSLLAAAGVLAAGFLVQTPVTILLAVSAVLFCCIMCFPVSTLYSHASTQTGGTSTLPRWLHLLSTAEHAVQVGVAQIVPKEISIGNVIKLLIDSDPSTQAVKLGNKTVAWFSKQPLSRADTVSRLGGTLRRLEMIDMDPSRIAVEKTVVSLCKGLNTELDTDLFMTKRVSKLDMRRMFETRFIDGQVIDIKSGAVMRGKTGLTSMELKSAMHSLFLGKGDAAGKPKKAGRFLLFMFCPAGEPELLFCVELQKETKKIEAFTKFVYRQTLLQSLGRTTRLSRRRWFPCVVVKRRMPH